MRSEERIINKPLGEPGGGIHKVYNKAASSFLLFIVISKRGQKCVECRQMYGGGGEGREWGEASPNLYN